jgi:hypothetical protein
MGETLFKFILGHSGTMLGMYITFVKMKQNMSYLSYKNNTFLIDVQNKVEGTFVDK